MTPEEALAKLAEAGEDSGADYDDADGGWFGWSVDEDGVLRVTWQPVVNGHADAGPVQEFAWELRARTAAK